MKGIVRTHVGFLVWGIVFWFPIAIVAFVLVFLLGNMESIGRSIFLFLFPARYFYQGLGVALGLVILYVSGIVLKTTKIQKRLSKVPIIGLFFGGGEVITVDRLMNLTPCLFLYSPTMPSYGWILSEEKVTVGQRNAYPSRCSTSTIPMFPPL